MNYLFNRDVTFQFKKDRIINDKDLVELLESLVQKEYADRVSDEVYIRDKENWRQKIFENGVRLDKLQSIDEFKAAFVKRGVFYDPLWRKQDYVWAAEKYIFNTRERDKEHKRKRCGLDPRPWKKGDKK